MRRDIFDKPYTLKEIKKGAVIGLLTVIVMFSVMAFLFWLHIDLGDKLIR